MAVIDNIKQKKKNDLRPRQKRFCELYVVDWNASQAYREAYGPNIKDTVCRANASRLLTKDSIQAYIRTLTDDLEKTAGVSKLWIVLEHKKIIGGGIADLHDSWITRKEFNDLTPAQKACIS